jgi:hypothetical protein
MADDDYDLNKDPEIRAAIEAERKRIAGSKSAPSTGSEDEGFGGLTAEVISIEQKRSRGKEGGHGAGKKTGAKPASDRPIIRIYGGELPRITDEAEAALIAGGSFNLYQRGGEIVRPVLEEMPGPDSTKTQSWRIVSVSRAHVGNASLARHCS